MIDVAPPVLHAGQAMAYAAFRLAQYLVLYCGRQWGKSRFCCAVGIRTAFNGGRVWWIAPSFPQSEEAWDLLVGMLAGKPGVRINIAGRRVTFPSGGYIRVRTSERPDSLRGAAVDLLILDEAAFIPERVWTEILYPTLAVRRGKAIFATTPNGQNWMFDMYNRGVGGPDAEGYVSLRFAAADNPYMPADRVEAARRSLPPALFAQEWLGEPSAGEDGLIPREWAIAASQRPKVREGRFVLGIDVAGGGGDRAMFALRFGDHIVELQDHTPKVKDDFGPMEDAAAELLGRHGGYCVVDAVGIGAGLASRLRTRGFKVLFFKAGKALKLRDETGQFSFNNQASAAWWHLRTLLDPRSPRELAIPDDRTLIAELCAPRYDTRAGAKIAVESKDEVKKRIGRSPDMADSICFAYWDRLLIQSTEGAKA